MSLRSLVIIVIRRFTTLEIVPSQKTSYSLGNFYVSNCKLGAKCQSPITSFLYLLFGPVLKKQAKTRAFINSDNQVNVMKPICIAKLGFTSQKTRIRAQKIDVSTLETYDMVLARFSL